MTPTRAQKLIDKYLIMVRDELRSGKLKHARARTANDDFVLARELEWPAARDDGAYTDVAYNQGFWNGQHTCGTVCCIKGRADMLMERDGLPYNMLRLLDNMRDGERAARIHRLFGDCPPQGYTAVTPAEAADTIDRVLAGREPWWCPPK